MTKPDRAARLWLAVAVATLWLLSVGGEAEETIPVSTVPDVTALVPGQPRTRRATRLRLVSVFRRGWNLILVALLDQAPCPWAASSLNPGQRSRCRRRRPQPCRGWRCPRPREVSGSRSDKDRHEGKNTSIMSALKKPTAERALRPPPPVGRVGDAGDRTRPGSVPSRAGVGGLPLGLVLEAPLPPYHCSTSE